MKSQRELLQDLKMRLDDLNQKLGTEAQYYAAISDSVRAWSRKVVVPHIYTLPDGFSTGTYEYALPNYIHGPFLVQSREAGNTMWGDVISVDTEPYTLGNQLSIGTRTGTRAARIIWYRENGPVPVTVPTVYENVTDESTQLAVSVTNAPDLGTSGFVRVGSEWISYAGILRTTPEIYLLYNLGRGVYDTLADSHTVGDEVQWGVAVDDQKLWLQLYNQATSFIHGYNLHKSTTEDNIRHQQSVQYFGTLAADFWRTQGYVSQRKPQVTLDLGTGSVW